MTDQAIRALRLSRQRLTEPVADRDDFLALFRLMQPVKPIAFSCPGDPPSLFPRCALGDARFTQPLRAARDSHQGPLSGRSHRLHSGRRTASLRRRLPQAVRFDRPPFRPPV